MKITLVLLTFLCIGFSVHSQNYQELSSKAITYQEDGQPETGLSFTQKKDVKVRATGSDDTLTLKNLKFSNTSFVEAKLTFDLHVCLTDDNEPGAYFVTISFFDTNKNCLLSSSFISSGSVLYEIPENEYSNPQLKMEIGSDNCYDFSGEAQVPIHHAFFYSDKESAGGIKPIKSFTITAFHLVAG